MSIMETISPELSDSVLNCLGERFHHGPMKIVRMETKGEKLDTKILALSKYRAFILSFKIPTKLEHEFHYLEIHQLESLKPLQLKIHVSLKKDSLSKTVYNLSVDSSEDVDTIIEIITLEIKKCFPNVFPAESIIPRITTSPESRMTSLNMKLEETFPDAGPCGGFTQMYACMCDLHQEAYMPEVAWDVDTIYLSHDSKELCLNDFDHLSNRDLVPIIAALIHNNWFSKLSFRNASKLSADATREINKVLQKSSCLEQLILENVGLKWSFTQDMCTAVLANRNTALRHINLSNNSLDDRGIRYLSSLLTKLPNGLVELNLAKTGLTAEGTLHLGKALVQNNFMSTSLVKLDVSGNVFKDGDISNLTGFLAQPNSLTHINMADTECALDNVFVALFRGCCANLSHLNLAGNTFTYRKGKDVPIQVSFKQFFGTTTKLKYLNLSRNKLPSEVVKEVLMGIGGNDNLRDVELDLSCNELKTEGGQVVAGSIAYVNNITTLNLSDNDLNLELVRLIDWIGQNRSLQSLDISKNMGGLKYKQLLKVLDTIVQVVQNEGLSLHTLSLADNKMKFETIQIINALGSNTTLTSIDISGNGMGDIGARMLAKALQLNTKLHTVKLDGNGITAVGFTDLANALEKNYTLKYMPTPVNDVSAALKSQPEKTSASLQKIQNLLQRNHSQHKFQDEQAFRLQQGFLYTTSHQMVDKLVVQIQDAIKGLIDCSEDDIQADINKAQDYILDADNSKLLLAALQQVALNAESSSLKLKLGEMASDLRGIVEAQLEASATGMIDTANEQCSNVMLNSTLKESLETMCQEQTKIPPRFLQDVVEQVGAAVSNRMGEAHLAMASHISDTLIDEIMEQLTGSYQKLSDQLLDYRERKGSVLFNGMGMEMNDKDAGNEKDEYAKKEDGDVAGEEEAKDTEAGQQRRIGKVRPRSVIMKDFELTVVEMDDTDSGDKLENDQTDSLAVSKPPLSPTKPKSPVPKVDKKTAKKAAADTKALDEAIQATETLSDVRKNRVRPPRQRPTRPSNQPQKSTPSLDGPSTAPAVDTGISDFFAAELNVVKPSKLQSQVSSVGPVQNSTESTELKPKKKRLFQKKDKKDEEKSKKEEKKEESGKGKKFGFKGIFKRKHSLPNSEEQEQVTEPDTRQGSHPRPTNEVSAEPTVTKEESKKPDKEPSPKVVEKKPLCLPTNKRSLKSATSPSKEPQPGAETKAPEPEEEAKINDTKEEAEAIQGETASQKEVEVRGEASDQTQDTDQKQEEKVEEKVEEKEKERDSREEAGPEEVKEKEKNEEEKKPVPEVRKPGLVGAQMLGGTNMLLEMKRKQEKKAADRASRELLESQVPKIEDQPKEKADTSPVAADSSEKPVSSIKLPLPRVTTSGPTSPTSGIKSPTTPPKVSPVKPTLTPRVKSPIEKAPLNQLPLEANETKAPHQNSKENAVKSTGERPLTEASVNEKPKLDKEKPTIKKRPLSGKSDAPPGPTATSPPTTPEMPSKSEASVKPSDILKRNSTEVKARLQEHPASPDLKPDGAEASKPPSRPSSLSEDKHLDSSAAKPSTASVSPRPKPRPAKRPVSIAPGVAKKPENADLRKASAPAVSVTLSPSNPDTKRLETPPDKPPLKSLSLNKDKPPPTVASKPRSRSLDPVVSTKAAPKPSAEVKGDTLPEVPDHDGRRDSVLSRSSDEGTVEEVDHHSAL
ncbi:F-actin-uncapping protein LRRC16A-like isoform X2 [Acanthaster planci]|uniref:F-actin-uncapping protein LRRC16A-like isoform X2 n=1 Tax=Acanthaster planci TaxID=133434 RepID=A0A8B7ZCI0_ACAPL|nr:F-actin-uncapping protein LRRC16A-like isoform X2 [Acanthaster planci]